MAADADADAVGYSADAGAGADADIARRMFSVYLFPKLVFCPDLHQLERTRSKQGHFHSARQYSVCNCITIFKLDSPTNMPSENT
jgi:hypothetical protein